MTRRARPPKPGEGQLPLILPESDWEPPAELPDLRHCGTVAVDTEEKDEGLSQGRGPGWALRAGHVCGVSAAWRAGGELRSIYVPVRHPDSQNFDHDAVGRWLDDLYRSEALLVFQNAGYDLGWSRAEWGTHVPPGSRIRDVGAAAVMLDENRFSYRLKDLCKWVGVPGKDEALLREAAAAYGWQTDFEVKCNLWQLPAKFAGPYGAGDAEVALQVHEKMAPLIEADGVDDAYQLECDLIPMCLEMRWRGIRVDLDHAEEAKAQVLAMRDEALAEIESRLGETVTIENVRSPGWLERAHDAQGVNYPRTPKTGRGSFTSGSRGGWMDKHPHWLPKLVARARKMEDAAEKFIQGFILDFAHRGRVHATVNQFRSNDEQSGGSKGTRSHRFSYSDPALQQMPERDPELGPLIRGCFIPEDGEKWGAHDYSQQEYRMIVHAAALVNAPKVWDAVKMYRDDPNTDFHQLVVEWTGLDRKRAKDCNFGKAFGAGVPKFAAMIGKSEEEAAEIYAQYDRELPFVKETARDINTLAARRGYVKLIDGARCHWSLWELTRWEAKRRGGSNYPMPLDAAREKHGLTARLQRYKTHVAFNRWVQGSSARQTKIAMRTCWETGHVPLLQMHDDLNFSHAREEEGQEVAEIMRTAVQLQVPSVVDSEYGTSWGDAKHAWAEARAR